MSLVLLMTVAAVVVIIVDVEGYPTIPDLPGKAHPILGFVTLGFVVINVSAILPTRSSWTCREN